MNIIPTELNKGLSWSIRKRIAAEDSYTFGRVGFWHLVGAGLMVFGIGSAMGLCFFGYSKVIQKTEKIGLLSSLLSNSLASVRLRANAEGTVRLEPRDLSLAQGQTISLARDSYVSLDASSTVTANGEVAVQLPSISVPSATITPRTAAPIPLVTNFTVFKSVALEKGSVMTGWIFLTSAQAAPTRQYCYYTESLETPGFDNISVGVGIDGKPDAPKTLPPGFDINAAFDKCVWFASSHD
jgi:hypothetical protein